MRKVVLALALVLPACLKPNPPSGAILCGASQPQCPDGYQCIADHCWKPGDGPDLASPDEGAPDLLEQPDLAEAPDLLRVPNKHQGEACTATDLCDTGHCVDGYCCESACADACKACNVTGLEGTCSDVGAGNDPVHGTCNKEDASTCGPDGKCDGAGACRKYVSGTACSTPSCNTSTGDFKPASLCDGSGTCVATTGYNCAPYLCKDATSCNSSCTDVAQCSSGNLCTNNSCGLLDDGRACTANAQCKNAHCVDGYCCNSVCTGTCQACDLPNKIGTCTTVPSGQPHGTRGACPGTSPCQGSCNGTSATACTSPTGNVCKTSCKSTTTETDFVCDGAGACKTIGTDKACSNGFACSGTTCAATCVAGGSQCQAGYNCSNNRCVVAETDCLDGKDNNGDGLIDCDDPSCTDVVYVNAPAAGNEVGTVTADACPSGFGAAEVLHKDLSIPPCSGCSCTYSVTCALDISAYTQSTTCGAGKVSLGTFTASEDTATSNGGFACRTFSAVSMQSFDYSNARVIAHSCSGAGTANRGTPTWRTTANFCPSPSSSYATTGKLCVRKPTVGRICIRVPDATSGCPAGFTTGPTDAYYTGFSDLRTCGQCGCSDTPRCQDFGSFGTFVAGSTCPISLADIFTELPNQTCYAVSKSLSAGTLYFTSPLSSCSASASTNGTVTPTGGSTVCCQ